MSRVLNSFKVRSGLRLVDYRLGGSLDLQKVETYFQAKGYQVSNLQNSGRHITGILTKVGTTYFLKLSTSEGISVVTKNEFKWNNNFSNHFPNTEYRVPKNYDSGLFDGRYFYLITDYFDGKLLCKFRSSSEDVDQLVEYIPQIIQLSEIIQGLSTVEGDYQKKFINKVKAWFNDIPADIRQKYNVVSLLEIVEQGVSCLQKKPRHGDFAPWHIFQLSDGAIGLIDGEHALVDGVEYYDICYFIQRVFSVLRKPDIAKKIYLELEKREYKINDLRTVLAARAVGGFLDESLSGKPNYVYADSFKDWILRTKY